MTQYDYCPWLFWREAPAEARNDQLQHQARWKDSGKFQCGERCYLSPAAGFVPENVVLGDDCFIAGHAYVTDELTAGNHCTINPFAVVRGNVRLGDGVRIGAHASVIGFTHNVEDTGRPIYQQGISAAGICIGDDVWIGSGSIILDGVSVGSHSIVAAGAIVTKDVSDWSVVAGNPARHIKDRRNPRPSSSGNPSLEHAAQVFGERVRGQWPDILQRCEIHVGDHVSYRDRPDRPASGIRPLADAIEIAAGFAAVPPIQSREELIRRLQDCQDPKNGMPSDPFTPLRADYSPRDMNDGHAAYMVLSIGHALECLGSHFTHPLRAAQEMSIELMYARLAAQPWKNNAWGAGAWVDALGTAMWMNRQHFGLPGPVAPLFDWLRGKCSTATGLWGDSRTQDGWLEPVNGFYRLTRGTFAQFGLRVPYPEAAMDTILSHITLNTGFREHNVNACNLLDVVHPIWLLGQATDHRRHEAHAFIRRQLPWILGRWVDGQGFGFAPSETPGLQGTEMWLSIIRIALETLGIGETFPFQPAGVHRLRPPPLPNGGPPVRPTPHPADRAKAGPSLPTFIPGFRGMWA